MKANKQIYHPDHYHGRQVRIYWNLNKHLFSIQELNKNNEWRVTGYVHEQFNLTAAEFIVNKKIAYRVLVLGKKEVHAYIQGTLSTDAVFYNSCYRIRYDPFYRSDFFNEDTKENVTKAKLLILNTVTSFDGKLKPIISMPNDRILFEK